MRVYQLVSTNATVTSYRKLVETFHFVSECKTAVYFSRCLVQAFAQQYNCFDHWYLYSIECNDSWQTQSYNC